jgi:diguanylate cyclase (GGDEF)-like protein
MAVNRGIFSSLRFADPGVEESFRAHDCRATVPIARFCYFTGCFLWAGFGVVDILLAPDHLAALWAIRFGVGLPALMLACLATSIERLQRSLKLVGVAVTLLCGGSIIAMIAILEPPVSDSYYVGLILVLFCSYIFAQLRFFQAVSSSVALFAAYELTLALRHPLQLDILINNSAFVASTIYIGMFTCFKLEQHRRTEYSYRRTIEEQSSHDVLTGLLNRRQLAAIFELARSRLVEAGEPSAVMLIDVDDFKHINDRSGHDVGDDVLAGVATAIRSALGDGDWAFRYGGDEFLVLLPGASAVAGERTARRIRAAAHARAAGAAGPTVSLSIGVTEIASPDDTLRAVMRRADTALYHAKRQGKGRTVVHPRAARPVEAPRVAGFRTHSRDLVSQPDGARAGQAAATTARRR